MEAFQKYSGQAFDPEKHIFALTSEIMLQLVSDGVKIVIRGKEISTKNYSVLFLLL